MPTPEPRDPSRVARQAQMRDQNLGVALRGIVDAAEPLSRAQLAASRGPGARRPSRGSSTTSSRRAWCASSTRRRPSAPAAPPSRSRPRGGPSPGVGMEVNVDYLGVRALDLAGDVLAEHVELDDLRGADAADGAATGSPRSPTP